MIRAARGMGGGGQRTWGERGRVRRARTSSTHNRLNAGANESQEVDDANPITRGRNTRVLFQERKATYMLTSADSERFPLKVQAI